MIKAYKEFPLEKEFNTKIIEAKLTGRNYNSFSLKDFQKILTQINKK